MKHFINRYQLVLFFPLAYLLSWWFVLVIPGAQNARGPAYAAILLTAISTGIVGLRSYWKQITHWRAGWWYLVAPLIVIGYEGIAFAFSLASGAKLVTGVPLLSISVVAQLLLFGGQWEELGWTGYALPKLRQHFANRPNGGLVAVLVLGALRAVWHLPLFLYGRISWFDVIVLSLAFQIIIAWLYDRSGGSVPCVMLLHFTSNVMGAIAPALLAGTDLFAFRAIFVALAALFALVLVGFQYVKLGRQKVATLGN